MSADIVERVRAQVSAQAEQEARAFARLVDDVARGHVTDADHIAAALHDCRRSPDDLGRELERLRAMREAASLVRRLPELRQHAAEAREARAKIIENHKAAKIKAHLAMDDPGATPEQRGEARMRMAELQAVELVVYRRAALVATPHDEDEQRALEAEGRLIGLVPADLRQRYQDARSRLARAESHANEARAFVPDVLNGDARNVTKVRRAMVERLELPEVRTNESAYRSAQARIREFERRHGDHERLSDLEREEREAREERDAAYAAILDYPEQFGAA